MALLSLGLNPNDDDANHIKSAYNALNGFPAPIDPAPYKGQLTGALNNNRFML